MHMCACTDDISFKKDFCYKRRAIGNSKRSEMDSTYVVRTVCNAHARVMEAENSITLTIYSSEHVFIAPRWRSEMIMGFHEYTYQDREYIIRAMNTKHAQCTLNPIHMGLPAPGCTYNCTLSF